MYKGTKNYFITLQIHQQLYLYLEDNERYFDWITGVNNFITQKVQNLSNQNRIYQKKMFVKENGKIFSKVPGRKIPEKIDQTIESMNTSRTSKVVVPVSTKLFKELEK